MERPEDCPFCGCQVKATQQGFQHPYDPDDVCFMNGHHVGKSLVKRWNKRVTPAAKTNDPSLNWVSLNFTVDGGDVSYTLHGMVNLAETKGIADVTH